MVKNLHFSISSTPAVGRTQPHIQRVAEALICGVRRQGRGDDHSPSNYSRSQQTVDLHLHSPYAFMAQKGTPSPFAVVPIHWNCQVFKESFTCLFVLFCLAFQWSYMDIYFVFFVFTSTLISLSVNSFLCFSLWHSCDFPVGIQGYKLLSSESPHSLNFVWHYSSCAFRMRSRCNLGGTETVSDI